MKYFYAEDIQKTSEEISRILFPHIKIDRMKCFRSHGSSSRGTIARCHTIGKLLQRAMDTEAFYALEFISEKFDKLPEEEKIKTIIHELMHIPHTFGGGFRHHDHVCEKNINRCYRTYKEKLEKLEKEEGWKNQDNIKQIKDMGQNAEKGFF